MKQYVGDYLGRVFEVDTEDYVKWGIKEQEALNLARLGFTPDVLEITFPILDRAADELEILIKEFEALENRENG